MTPLNDRYTKVGNYYVRRPQATRYESRWTDGLKDAGEVLLHLLVLLALFIGLPFLLWLVAASPAAAARQRPFISVNQDDPIIYGDWFTVSYAGSDYARASCTQDGVKVWDQLIYLPGEGGPIQITPVIPYHAGTYTPCEIDLVKLGKHEKVLASDTFTVRSPV